jgi:ribosomal-protein-alanine N-acetyltransferase
MMPMLETERLSVRPFVEEDFDALVALREPWEVRQYLGGARNTVEFTRMRLDYYLHHYKKYGYSMGVVSLKDSPVMIGWGGLQHFNHGDEIEVGYAFAQTLWGRGLATELASAWLKFGFTNLDLDRIIAVADEANSGSRRVMEKIGMRHEKDIMHYGHACAYYAVSREAFFNA